MGEGQVVARGRTCVAPLPRPSEASVSSGFLSPPFCCVLQAAVHKAIVDVVTCAVEVEADSARFPKEWLFHYR